jgi:hypothetical protein
MRLWFSRVPDFPRRTARHVTYVSLCLAYATAGTIGYFVPPTEVRK